MRVPLALTIMLAVTTASFAGSSSTSRSRSNNWPTSTRIRISANNRRRSAVSIEKHRAVAGAVSFFRASVGAAFRPA